MEKSLSQHHGSLQGLACVFWECEVFGILFPCGIQLRVIFLYGSVDCNLSMAGKRLGRLVLDGSLNYSGYKQSSAYVGTIL